MAETNTPTSGSETSITVTLNGKPILINSQVDSVSEQQSVTLMEHKPVGSMVRKTAQDFGGWSGRISAKPTNTLLRGMLDTIESAARLGLPTDVKLTVRRTYRDLTPEVNTYTAVRLSQTGGTRQRGQFDTIEIAWESGEQRVSA